MGRNGGSCWVILTFPQLLIVLVPRAASSHLPDFIRDDLSLALTIDGSGSPLTTSETSESSLYWHAWQEPVSSEPWSPVLGAWGGTPCRKEQLGTGMGRVASGVFLLVCSWISGYKIAQPEAEGEGHAGHVCWGMIV